MSFAARCQTCGKMITVKVDPQGKRVRCAKCRQTDGAGVATSVPHLAKPLLTGRVVWTVYHSMPRHDCAWPTFSETGEFAVRLDSWAENEYGDYRLDAKSCTTLIETSSGKTWTLRSWNNYTSNPEKELSGPYALTSDGRFLICPEGLVDLSKKSPQNLKPWEESPWEAMKRPTVCRASPSGRWMAAAGPPQNPATPDDKSLVLLNQLKTGGKIARKRIPQVVSDLAFSRDENYLAVAVEVGDVRFLGLKLPGWFRRTCEVSQVVVVHAQAIPSANIDFSPAENLLVTVRSHDVALWEVPSGDLRTALAATTGEPWRRVAFSSDGSALATQKLHQIHVWDVESGRQRMILDSTEPVRAMSFLENDTRLAVMTDNTLRNYDV